MRSGLVAWWGPSGAAVDVTFLGPAIIGIAAELVSWVCGDRRTWPWADQITPQSPRLGKVLRPHRLAGRGARSHLLQDRDRVGVTGCQRDARRDRAGVRTGWPELGRPRAGALLLGGLGRGVRGRGTACPTPPSTT